MSPKWVLAAVLLVGCGSAGKGLEDGVDAGAGAPDAADPKGPRLEVGTGQDHFIALTDGDSVEIAHGPQGGNHVWGAVRAYNLDPKNLEIEYWLDLTDGAVNVEHNKYRLSLLPKGDYSEWFGMTLFVRDPAQVDGKRLTIRMEAKDTSGHVASDARQVVPHLPVSQ